tara:strand:- start:1233 stop:1445 length:213 start_codon:yes stop_codon:yes gene_type:complete
MAFVTINNRSGTATKWAYDNGSTLRGATSGILTRTHNGQTQDQIYVSCRRIDKTGITGELSKTYYDNLND